MVILYFSHCFSEKITDALIEESKDKNWKVRGEALQKVATILSEAKFVTGNLGPLPEALKARLSESNKNLVSGCQYCFSHELN